MALFSFFKKTNPTNPVSTQAKAVTTVKPKNKIQELKTLLATSRSMHFSFRNANDILIFEGDVCGVLHIENGCLVGVVTDKETFSDTLRTAIEHDALEGGYDRNFSEWFFLLAEDKHRVNYSSVGIAYDDILRRKPLTAREILY